MSIFIVGALIEREPYSICVRIDADSHRAGMAFAHELVARYLRTSKGEEIPTVDTNHGNIIVLVELESMNNSQNVCDDFRRLLLESGVRYWVRR